MKLSLVLFALLVKIPTMPVRKDIALVGWREYPTAKKRRVG